MGKSGTRASQALLRKMGQLKALALDVDGVLTDGVIYYDAQGVALKGFYVRDGMGLARIQEAGMRVALISADRAPLVERRAEKLRIADVYQGVEDKAGTLLAFAREYMLDPAEVGFVGDDLNDLGPMNAAGVAFCPSDAAAEVRRIADYVASRPGGRGAVREICDLLLALRKSEASASRRPGTG